MENVISSFLTLPTIIFMVIIYLAVLVFRKGVEFSGRKIAYVFPDKYEPWWTMVWREYVLLAAPSIFGGLIAFLFTGYPFPEVFNSNIWARISFGIVAGLCTNNAYTFFNFHIKKFLPKKVKEVTDKAENATSVPPDSGV